ncbi:MAG: helix-turn-helix transcriptional regulator [Clostridia bacterium]|nr:helix-turn-helix transcriptional regulator [Clostridia bacterium]
MPSLGESIIKYRHQSNLSQLDLSLSSGIARNTIYRIEHEISTPTLKTIARIEEGLNLPENTLLRLCSPSSPGEIHCTIPKTCLSDDGELVLTLHVHLSDESS